MNPHCQCPAAGFCERHKLAKSPREFELCKGTAGTVDCGRKYWYAWEAGKLGATAPANPIMHADWPCEQTRGLGDVVANGIKRATFGMVKPCGGCKSRQAALNSIMPMRDPPSVEAVEFAEPLTRNLTFFLWPVKGHFIDDLPVWEWHCRQLEKYAHLFNGRRIVTISASPSAEPADAIRERLKDFTDEFLVVRNNPKLREVAGWIPMLEKLESHDANEVTFCAHGKGVRYDLSSPERRATIARWIESMYEICLSDWPAVQAALRDKAMAGAWKLYGMFPTRGNNRWIYSGSFYWFRNRDAYRRNWRHVDRRFFGTESWPGHMFKAAETACLCGDDTKSLYEEPYWEQTAGPQLAAWRAEHPPRPPIEPHHAKDERFAIVTAAWGGYWEKFGRQFLASIARMNPGPREIVVVTDSQRINPSEFPGVQFLRPTKPGEKWTWFNDGVAATSAEWIINCGIDDLFFPDALRDFDLGGEVVAYSGMHEGEPWTPDAAEYQRILNASEGNPMRGGCMCRRETFLRFPWREMIWPDWAQWIDFAHHGLDVRFDYRPRFEHRRHDAAHSLHSNPQGEAEIENLRNQLRAARETEFASMASA